jgi:hypothetical protein
VIVKIRKHCQAFAMPYAGQATFQALTKLSPETSNPAGNGRMAGSALDTP